MNQYEHKVDNAEPQGFKFSESGDDFSDIDLLINNYAALSSKYKVPSKVDLPLIKQFYLMMTKLEYDKNDKGFFMQYYVPIYKKILQRKISLKTLVITSCYQVKMHHTLLKLTNTSPI